jgi:hypothetical protein
MDGHPVLQVPTVTATRYEVRTVSELDHVRILKTNSNGADTVAARESERPSIAYASVYCNDVWLTSYINGRRASGASDVTDGAPTHDRGTIGVNVPGSQSPRT